MNFLSLVLQAGPILWVILVLSLVVVYLFFLHLQTLARLRASKAMVAKVHAALMQQDLVAAMREADEKSLSAKVLRAGLERLPVSVDAAQAAMTEAILYEEERLLRPVDVLGTIAQVAPLLGLLGTVIGMIRSFVVFAQTVNPTAAQLSTGISEALVNTAAGLIVAIAGYAGRSMLRNRANALLLEADRVREALPGWVNEAILRRQGKLAGTFIPPYNPTAEVR